MPRTNTIVDSVKQVVDSVNPSVPGGGVPVATGPITVIFTGGGSAVLPASDPQFKGNARLLNDLQQMSIPVYAEIAPGGNSIQRILVPLTVKVTSVWRDDPTGSVSVELYISHALHKLNATNPDFDELLAALEDAQAKGTVVLVTEDEPHHEIIDVRPAPHDALAEAPVDEPPLLVRPVTMARATELFQLVAGQTCDPADETPTCIPFLYPDNGCWGRASEACRLIIAAGEQPAKLWIYGQMAVQTLNNPDCQVEWMWHVAAMLEVLTDDGSQPVVLDPALFAAPVSVAEWTDRLGNPSTPVPTAAGIFMRRLPGGPFEVDATFVKTAKVLATFRAQLLARSLSSAGAPPYCYCETPLTATAG